MKYRIKILKLSPEETYFEPQYYSFDFDMVIGYPFFFLLSLVGGEILTPSDLVDMMWKTIDVCDTKEEAKSKIEKFKNKKEFKTIISYEEI